MLRSVPGSSPLKKHLYTPDKSSPLSYQSSGNDICAPASSVHRDVYELALANLDESSFSEMFRKIMYQRIMLTSARIPSQSQQID